ncbi:MAG: hypothetical protein SGI98_07935 [Verrucomicrobiota bacterium]|nr:hypothetical protein [Verrucomicrobiota bacterium]
MITYPYNPAQWHESALRTLHVYTVRGAYPLIIGYPLHPDIRLLETHLVPCSIVGSPADTHTVPDYRAYVAIHHPDYRGQIVSDILSTLKSVRPDSIVLYKDIIHPNESATIAA